MPYSPPSNRKKNPDDRKAIWKRYDDKRENSGARGYDSSWQIVRKHHLQSNPLCADCLHKNLLIPATEVHHIKKLSAYPELRDKPNNLLSLCKSCHSIRTMRGE